MYLSGAHAEVAQLVEHLLAMQKVAGSNPVFRSSGEAAGSNPVLRSSGEAAGSNPVLRSVLLPKGFMRK